MKTIITLIAFLVPFYFFAQENTSDAAKYEHAVFLHNEFNKEAVMTAFSVINTPYADDEFLRIKSEMMEKEGIFLVELTDYNRTIKVYHFTDISSDDLKPFLLSHREKFEMKDAVTYSF